jgi:hypothetical protein
VPIISRFFGIVVTINYREHQPPHFHAWYSGREATINIKDGAVRGDLPRRVVGFLLEWLDMHRNELAENWQRAQTGEPLKPVDPLE